MASWSGFYMCQPGWCSDFQAATCLLCISKRITSSPLPLVSFLVKYGQKYVSLLECVKDSWGNTVKRTPQCIKVNAHEGQLLLTAPFSTPEHRCWVTSGADWAQEQGRGNHLDRQVQGSPRTCCVQERNGVFNNEQITMKKYLITYFQSVICSCTTFKWKAEYHTHKTREELGKWDSGPGGCQSFPPWAAVGSETNICSCGSASSPGVSWKRCSIADSPWAAQRAGPVEEQYSGCCLSASPAGTRFHQKTNK